METRTFLAAHPLPSPPATIYLDAAFATRLPAALPVAGTNRVVIRDNNLGRALAAGSLKVDLFASTDTALDSSDLLLGSTAQSVKLGHGGKTNVVVNFATPTTLTDGKYFLIARVDASGIAGGSPAIQNIVSRNTVTIDQPFSDVAISFAGLPNRPIEIDGRTSGQSAAIVRLVNSGNVRVKTGFAVSYYLSTDNVLDSTDPLLAQSASPPMNLKPGKGKGVSLRLAVPPGTVIGGYFLFAVLTPSDGAVDTRANNDVAISSRRVAVVNRIPDRPYIHNEVVLYYGGPDYFYDQSVDYGYYDDSAVGGGPAIPDYGNGGGTSFNQGDTSNATTQPSQPSDSPPASQPSTQPVDGGQDDTNPPDSAAPPDDDNSGSDNGNFDSGGGSGGDFSGGDNSGGDNSDGDDSSGDDSGGDASGGDDSSDSFSTAQRTPRPSPTPTPGTRGPTTHFADVTPIAIDSVSGGSKLLG